MWVLPDSGIRVSSWMLEVAGTQMFVGFYRIGIDHILWI
jgi:hypothetical protein